MHKCHEIIFADQLLPTNSPYAGLVLPAYTRRQKIKQHVEPVLVGLGVILASTPGMPHLVETMGPVAIEQGRRDEDNANIRSVEVDDTGAVMTASPQVSPDEVDETESPASWDGNTQAQSIFLPHFLPSQPGNLLSRRSTIGAQTLPALPLHLQTKHRSRHSEDPLGQLESQEVTLVPYQSSPSLPSARTPSRSTATQRADSLLEQLDSQSQIHLLRGNYFQNEVRLLCVISKIILKQIIPKQQQVQFLLGLENICNRLVIVPKLARVSALRAELTALNHKLPAEVNPTRFLCQRYQSHLYQVCMPMWCSTSDSPEGKNGIPVPHHKIVRIPPGEAVVLNSAERAPYLLYMEVLKDDLDFDPGKRSNREILRKIITKEEGQKHGWPEAGQLLSSLPGPTPRLNTADSKFQTPYTLMTTPLRSPSIAASTSTFSNADEEVDLVEQLYGADQPLRSKMLDIEDSIVLPPTPKNKELDIVAWSRASLPLTPDDSRSLVQHSQSHSGSPSVSRAVSSTPAPVGLPPAESETPRDLSLDDYSERMRTAAIMLAQLNVDLAREPSPLHQKFDESSNPGIIRHPRK